MIDLRLWWRACGVSGRSASRRPAPPSTLRPPFLSRPPPPAATCVAQAHTPAASARRAPAEAAGHKQAETGAAEGRGRRARVGGGGSVHTPRARTAGAAAGATSRRVPPSQLKVAADVAACVACRLDSSYGASHGEGWPPRSNLLANAESGRTPSQLTRDESRSRRQGHPDCGAPIAACGCLRARLHARWLTEHLGLLQRLLAAAAVAAEGGYSHVFPDCSVLFCSVLQGPQPRARSCWSYW